MCTFTVILLAARKRDLGGGTHAKVGRLWDEKLENIHLSVFHSWEQQLTDGFVERQMGLIGKTHTNKCALHFAAIEGCRKQQFSLINKCHCFCSFKIGRVCLLFQKTLALCCTHQLSCCNLTIPTKYVAESLIYQPLDISPLIYQPLDISLLIYAFPLANLFERTYLSRLLTWGGGPWRGGRRSAVGCCAGRTLRMWRWDPEPPWTAGCSHTVGRRAPHPRWWEPSGIWLLCCPSFLLNGVGSADLSTTGLQQLKPNRSASWMY